jgi:CBS domain/BON domain
VPEIAALLERHRIKRVPIVSNGKVIGIVSRSNLIQALASFKPASEPKSERDRSIRLELLDRLGKQPWADFGSRNVIVQDGIVHLWGLVGSESERKALTALAEKFDGGVCCRAAVRTNIVFGAILLVFGGPSGSSKNKINIYAPNADNHVYGHLCDDQRPADHSAGDRSHQLECYRTT